MLISALSLPTNQLGVLLGVLVRHELTLTDVSLPSHSEERPARSLETRLAVCPTKRQRYTSVGTDYFDGGFPAALSAHLRAARLATSERRCCEVVEGQRALGVDRWGACLQGLSCDPLPRSPLLCPKNTPRSWPLTVLFRQQV
jgi:hypothetical protein